jgi:hypothetical protein
VSVLVPVRERSELEMREVLPSIIISQCLIVAFFCLALPMIITSEPIPWPQHISTCTMQNRIENRRHRVKPTPPDPCNHTDQPLIIPSPT